MVTSATRSLLQAALAAVFILVSGCGGGDSSVPQGIENVAIAVAPAATAGQKRPLSAVTNSVPVPYFQVSSRSVSTGAASVEVRVLAAEVAVSQEERLLAWAEVTYPEYFPTREVTQAGEYQGHQYVFRRYQVSGGYNFAAVREDGTVWGLGPYVGSDEVPHYFGTVAEFGCQVEPTSCGPKLVSATLTFANGEVRVLTAAGAVGIPAKGTLLTLTFDQVLNCTGVSGRRLIGNLTVLVTCSGQSISFLPGNTGEERWPFSSENVVTAGGLPGATGFPSAPVTVRFTTAKVALTGVKVFVTNFEAKADSGNDVSIIDAATSQVQPVNLEDALNSVRPQRLVVDSVAGVVYVGAGGINLFRFDLETGLPLKPIRIDPTDTAFQVWHTMQGLVLSDRDICAAMGRQDLTTYPYRNKLLCWNRFSGAESFRSAVDYVAGEKMVVMDLVSVPERKKFYAVAAEALAYGFIVDSSNGQLKQEFTPGTMGTVVEIDADTKQAGRTFTVGAGPRSVVYNAAHGRLIVVNSGLTLGGERTLSLIDLATGTVTTQTLPGFVGYQRPQSAVLVEGFLYVTDYVSQVVKLDLATFKEVGRVTVGAYPVFLAHAEGQLYVPLPRFLQGGDRVAVARLDTLTLMQAIPVGKAPWYVAAQKF